MKIVWKKELESPVTISDQEIVDLILKNRSITDTQSFLKPPHPDSVRIIDLGFKKQMKQTLSLLEKIKKEGKMIVVYTDYDADGITGGTILWETLHMLGFKTMPYVPHRKHEGYGFSKKGIDNVRQEFDPALIISVDHGISGKKEIAYASSLGIKVVVTDHHLKPKEPPEEAEAIFHIPALSGSGVSYFFAKELFLHFANSALPNFQKIKTYFERDYLALASIGTIADLVSLTGVSRSIVYHGLKAFPYVKRRGIYHLIKEAGIDNKEITPYEIGFVIAPRINAVGRLEHAIDALRLLCTHNDKQAHTLATSIGSTNKDRQDLVTQAVKQAKQMVEEQKTKDEKLATIITLVSPNWNEGIIGLIASKITEAYNRPTIVMTKSDGFYKGSARSVNKFHMTDFLRSLDSYLVSVGGHMLAAGFSILEEKVNPFIKKVKSEAKKKIKEKDLEKIVETDLKIPLSRLRLSLAKKIDELAPFGMGNPYPLFFSEVLVLEKKLFGKKSEHIRLMVKDATSGSFPIEFLAFYKVQEYKHIEKGEVISVAYNPDINRWNGKETLQGKILAINQ